MRSFRLEVTLVMFEILFLTRLRALFGTSFSIEELISIDVKLKVIDCASGVIAKSASAF